MQIGRKIHFYVPCLVQIVVCILLVRKLGDATIAMTLCISGYTKRKIVVTLDVPGFTRMQIMYNFNVLLLRR
jgi:hypothetical protein